MGYFEYFSAAEMDEIHAATMRVLEEIGIDFSYGPARDLLAKAGCRIEGKRVYFKPEFVETMVKKAPSEFTLYGRDSAKNVIIGGDHIAYMPCYGSPFVLDLDRGRRESTMTDYENFAKLAYALEPMDITGGMMAEPNDIPVKERNARMMYASMRYSDKPFMGAGTGPEAARETIKMASMVFGSEQEMAKCPPFVSILCSLTPLGYDDKMAGAIMEYARAGMPQLISSLSISGATAPATMEGTLVVQNAEVLAGITLAQLVREGTPVVFAGSSSCAAMRYGTLSIGAPEMAVNTAATAQMSRYYGLPCRGGGALSDAKMMDSQAAYESMMSLQMAALSGINFVLHSAGILEGYIVSSYEKIIIDSEICGMCRRIKQGETVNAERLAFDVIKQVGPGGEYLSNMHTFKNFKKEFYSPLLEERNNFENWTGKGSLSMEQRANAKWKELLENYQEPSLPSDADKALNNYIDSISN
jgi:trimethylamine--corrinoid protein Co-methyltransferase